MTYVVNKVPEVPRDFTDSRIISCLLNALGEIPLRINKNMALKMTRPNAATTAGYFIKQPVARNQCIALWL